MAVCQETEGEVRRPGSFTPIAAQLTKSPVAAGGREDCLGPLPRYDSSKLPATDADKEQEMAKAWGYVGYAVGQFPSIAVVAAGQPSR